MSRARPRRAGSQRLSGPSDVRKKGGAEVRDYIGSTEKTERGPLERDSAPKRLLALIPLATCLGVAAVVLVIELL